jgi:hypothetical protein
MEKLQRDFSRFDEVDWNGNLYWSWLYTLKPLLLARPKGYPTCMTTPTYQARLLNTAMASWTQLRNDTVLYAQKRDTFLEAQATKTMKDAPGPIIPGRGDLLPVYLEPLAEVYGRLLALTRMSRHQLGALKVLNGDAQQRLVNLEKLLERVVVLAEKELANVALAKDEEQFLRSLPDNLRQLASAQDEKRIEKLQKELEFAKVALDEKRFQTVSREIFVEEYGQVTTPVVTTIAVDSTGRMVLQEAIGRVDLAVFVLPQPDGKLIMAAGPVLSYYEMKPPRDGALTEETWLRQMDRAPRPEWTPMYLVH